MNLPGGPIPSQRREEELVSCFLEMKAAGGFSEVSRSRDLALTKDLGCAPQLGGLGPCSHLHYESCTQRCFSQNNHNYYSNHTNDKHNYDSNVHPEAAH